MKTHEIMTPLISLLHCILRALPSSIIYAMLNTHFNARDAARYTDAFAGNRHFKHMIYFTCALRRYRKADDTGHFHRLHGHDFDSNL